MEQVSFNPVTYGHWDGDEFIPADGKDMLKKRNELAKKLKSEGIKVESRTRKGSLMTVGGIGTGKPQLEFIVNVPYLNIYGKN